MNPVDLINPVLDGWNRADPAAALAAMLACCGATQWAEAMVAARPLTSIAALSETADRLWSTMQETDWLEAFACHPRIGERKAQATGAVGCVVQAGASFGCNRIGANSF